jgi:hypothetical protein
VSQPVSPPTQAAGGGEKEEFVGGEAFLKSLSHRGMDLGLGRIRNFLTSLGDPQNQGTPPPHVARNEGKTMREQRCGCRRGGCIYNDVNVTKRLSFYDWWNRWLCVVRACVRAC